MNIRQLEKKAQGILTDVFGFDSFRPPQKQAIISVLSKKDTFVLLPTGGGKSLCYQIPALTLPGTTVVVSPLISLMKDQVDTLRANGIAAAYLNSSQELDEHSDTLIDLTSGNLKLLYVSPEKITTPSFIKLLKTLPISLFAIDEAHCISTWGHDFRPDYAQLSKLKQFFPSTPIIALTATADATTQQDILAQLEIDEATILSASFDRPNLSLSVQPAKERVKKIVRFLNSRYSQPGIIYCLTRKQTETLAKRLQQQGYTAASYHAGLSAAERSRIQKSFIRDKTTIICATIAFGMGIDKSNIRWVIHYNLPKSIESYYQEIGRAGRDGQPADTILFYTYADVERIKSFFIDRKQGTLQLAKLERMKEFAESVICRRKALLSYFGENYTTNCNNCDICKQPIPHSDTSNTSFFILQTIFELSKNTHQVPTKQLLSHLTNKKGSTSTSWMFLISQLKNLGLILIHYDSHASLSLTKKGREQLSKEISVPLVPLLDYLTHLEK